MQACLASGLGGLAVPCLLPLTPLKPSSPLFKVGKRMHSPVKRDDVSNSNKFNSNSPAFFPPPNPFSQISFPPLDPSVSNPVFADTANSWPRFLLLKSTSNASSTNNISPFLLHKCLVGLAGTPSDIKRLRSGDFLIISANSKQSKTLLSTTVLGNSGISVSITPHPSLNSSKGVIRCPELDKTPVDEILSELSSQTVSNVVRHSVKRDGNTIPTHTYFITFNSPVIPQFLSVGYLRVKVSQYFPSPLRCYNCQSYGHGSRFCRSTARCGNCGSPDHSSSNCSASPSCFNCGGSHPASARDCPRWRQERDIIRLKIQKNISFPEARKLFNAQSSSSKTTYAATLTNSVSSLDSSTQTDLSFSPSDIVTFTVHKAMTSPNTQKISSSAQTPSIQTSSVSSRDNQSKLPIKNSSFTLSKTNDPKKIKSSSNLDPKKQSCVLSPSTKTPPINSSPPTISCPSSFNPRLPQVHDQ